MTTRINWISRHPLTNGQRSTLASLGFEGTEPQASVFSRDEHPAETLANIGIEANGEEAPEVAIVAPAWVVLALLRSGWVVYEFVNRPSARQRGVFICEGVWGHTLEHSVFRECPIPPESQEQGDLSPAEKGD